MNNIVRIDSLKMRFKVFCNVKDFERMVFGVIRLKLKGFEKCQSFLIGSSSDDDTEPRILGQLSADYASEVSISSQQKNFLHKILCYNLAKLLFVMQKQLNWYSRFHLGKHNYHIVSLLQFMQLPSVRSILDDKMYYQLLNSTQLSMNQQSLLQLKASIIKQIKQKYSSSSIAFKEYQILQLDEQHSEQASHSRIFRNQKRNKNKNKSFQGDDKLQSSNYQQIPVYSMIEHYQKQIIGDILSDSCTSELYSNQDRLHYSNQEVRIIFDKKKIKGKEILVQSLSSSHKEKEIIQKEDFSKSLKNSIIDILNQQNFEQPVVQKIKSSQQISEKNNAQINQIYCEKNVRQILLQNGKILQQQQIKDDKLLPQWSNERIRQLSIQNVRQSQIHQQSIQSETSDWRVNQDQQQKSIELIDIKMQNESCNNLKIVLEPELCINQDTYIQKSIKKQQMMNENQQGSVKSNQNFKDSRKSSSKNQPSNLEQLYQQDEQAKQLQFQCHSENSRDVQEGNKSNKLQKCQALLADSDYCQQHQLEQINVQQKLQLSQHKVKLQDCNYCQGIQSLEQPIQKKTALLFKQQNLYLQQSQQKNDNSHIMKQQQIEKQTQVRKKTSFADQSLTVENQQHYESLRQQKQLIICNKKQENQNLHTEPSYENIKQEITSFKRQQGDNLMNNLQQCQQSIQLQEQQVDFGQVSHSQKSKQKQDCSSDDIYNLHLYIPGQSQVQNYDSVIQTHDANKFEQTCTAQDNKDYRQIQGQKQYFEYQSEQYKNSETILKNNRSQTTNIAVNQQIACNHIQEQHLNDHWRYICTQNQQQSSIINQDSQYLELQNCQTPDYCSTPECCQTHEYCQNLSRLVPQNMQSQQTQKRMMMRPYKPLPSELLLEEDYQFLANQPQAKKKVSFKQKMQFKRFQNQQTQRTMQKNNLKKNFKLLRKQQANNSSIAISKRPISLPTKHKFPNKKLNIDKKRLQAILANTKVVHKDILIRFFKQN